MSRLLVQFTGAQSTGKTVLVNALKEYYKHRGVPQSFIGEISRTMKEAGRISGLDKNATVDDQEKLTGALLLRYFEEVCNNRLLILAERSPFCCYGYLKTIEQGEFGYAVDQIGRFIDTVNNMRNTVGVEVLTVYVPLNIPFTADGVREESSRGQVDQAIQDALNFSETKYHTLKSITVEDRVEEIAKIINKLL